MSIRPFVRLFLILSLLANVAARAEAPLANATILIIRHAEKPETGTELAPEGFQRATNYIYYFKHLELDGSRFHLDSIFAAADSKNSHRPRLTLTPLCRALNIPLDTKFKDHDPEELAAALRAQPHGRHILICWHHTAMSELLLALGAEPEALLPHGKWPEDVFGWMIELRYDANGQLMPGKSHVLNENLMPGDARHPIGEH